MGRICQQIERSWIVFGLLVVVGLARPTQIAAQNDPADAGPAVPAELPNDAFDSEVDQPTPPDSVETPAQPLPDRSNPEGDSEIEPAPPDETELDQDELDEEFVDEEFVDEDTPFGVFEGEDSDRLFQTRLYGYIDSFWEKVGSTPAGVDENGETLTESNPHEFDVLNFNIMVQGVVADRFRYFLNLAAPSAGSATVDQTVAVRNAWVEARIWENYINVRFGKTYRRFGLYNEILDAVPTFIGIEPPELFDSDHLIVTRTTNLMLHGLIPFGDNAFSYAVSTGNDERSSDQIPIGLDLRFDISTMLRVGTSFYTTSGNAAPSRAVGDGSPAGGVINWMDRDRYTVFGGYLQLTIRGLLAQVAYWQAEHDARRNPDAIAQVAAQSDLNPRQLARFFTDPTSPTAANAIRNADYRVQTFYIRSGYEFSLTDTMTLTPYVQLDWYRNPETVAAKDVGGDNEAGLSDDGEFYKGTVGVVFRPIPSVALKVDGSGHLQQFNGETNFYPEIRVSLSYLWELEF